MSTKPFAFSESEINVLKNFASINPSMIIHPDRFEVLNNAKSVVGKYNFEKAYDFEAFGIYECSEFLSILGAMKNPEIEVQEKCIVIKDGSSKIRYFTTAKDLLPQVPQVDANFANVKCGLCFDLPADKLASLFKMSTILKAGFVFFETDKKKVRITVADELVSTNNSFDVTIDDGIKTNELEKALKIPLTDLKILPGGYSVELSTSKISKWNSIGGVTYYVGCAVV